jgi:hypothetical protein
MRVEGHPVLPTTSRHHAYYLPVPMWSLAVLVLPQREATAQYGAQLPTVPTHPERWFCLSQSRYRAAWILTSRFLRHSAVHPPPGPADHQHYLLPEASASRHFPGPPIRNQQRRPLPKIQAALIPACSVLPPSSTLPPERSTCRRRLPRSTEYLESERLALRRVPPWTSRRRPGPTITT